MNIFSIIAIFLMILGGIFIIASIGISIFINNKKKNCTKETTAKIKEIIVSENRDKVDGFLMVSEYPKIEYDINGEHIEKVSSIGYMPKKYSVGQEVEICYNPNKYDDFCIKGDKTANIIRNVSVAVEIGIFIIGIIFCIVSIFQ